MLENKTEQNIDFEKKIDTDKMSNEINTIVNQEVGKDKPIQVNEESVRVMPAKFLPQSPKKQFSTKQKIIFAVSAFVLFLILVITGMLLWAKSSVQPNNNTDNNLPTNNNQQQVEQPIVEQPKADQKILDDLQTLKTGLNRYFSDFQFFPTYLSDLKPDYLQDIPTQTDGSSYQYQSISNANDFSVIVDLDGSVNPKQVGTYQFTKIGLNLYDPNNVNNNNENNNNNNNDNNGTGITAPPPPPPTSNNFDVDQDALSRDEEALFGTNANDSDTDNDGYSDGTEIMNLYNPLVPGESLANSSLVSTFNNPDLSYRLLYPASWVANLLNNQYEKLQILSDSELGDNFSIVLFSNVDQLNLQDWSTSAPDAQSFVNPSSVTLGKNKISAIQADLFGDTVVLAATSDYLLLITYDVNAEAERYFNTTFQMMLNSFEFISNAN